MKRPRAELRDDSGVILVLVLLILVAVVALALSLGRDARVEVAVASVRADELRLRALVDSAVERALAELRLDTDPGDTLLAPWRDDQARFSGVELGGGRFWFLLQEPDPGDGREVRYGFKDTASLLNVNAATRDQLLALPGITDEAVDGILDWRDSDDEVRDQGAESSYYLALDPPYRAKNGPFESLDELLRVKGIDAAMLYGEDRNRNGVLDPGEDDGDRSFPPDDADGVLDRGLVDYLTVYANELNRTKDGEQKLNFTSASTGDITQRLDAAGIDPGVRARVMLAKAGGGQVSSMGQLLARVRSSDPEQVAILLDQLTFAQQEPIPGRVNINTCAKAILAGLPGLTEEDVQAILQKRLEAGDDRATPAWVLGVVPLERFVQAVDLMTCRSDQFIIHVVALLDDRPRFRRLEVLVDRNYAPPRVLIRRDLTSLGFPFPNERGEDHP